MNANAQQHRRHSSRSSDLEEYATGTLRAFLLHLDEQQKGFVDWAVQGPTLRKGGPGSGKSTLYWRNS